MTTYSFGGVLEGSMYMCVRNVLQRATKQGEGRCRMLRQWVPYAGVSLNYCVKYYIKFYHPLIINLIV